ncbi:uncharacterized protein LOC131162170 isoform X1 [Malania oleifera]|uniref:uncharacterized protein LOC131162170 isoform X1 n=1 Tax=Malania oleifera TaxID=397392 RepID=UPI0025AE5031|nr:uncharacterized protein LOC131162170 isoform X1 [Malania oleifera]
MLSFSSSSPPSSCFDSASSLQRLLHSCRLRSLEREREAKGERQGEAEEERRRGREKGGAAMITRSNLADQLREYQIRSKHDWASVSFFSSTSNLTSRRSGCYIMGSCHSGRKFFSCMHDYAKIPEVDVVVFVVWELIILAFLVFSAVSLYFRHMRLALILVCITMLLLLCMKITKQIRLARKRKRRMLLPLSM